MELTVSDGYGGIATDDVQITIANINNPPTADAGMNQQVQEGDLVSLHGTAVTSTERWSPSSGTQISGPPITLNPTSGQDASFTAPTVGSGDPNAFVELGFTPHSYGHVQRINNSRSNTVHVANTPHAPVAVVTGPPHQPTKAGTRSAGRQHEQRSGLDPLTYSLDSKLVAPPVTLVYSPGDTAHVMPIFSDTVGIGEYTGEVQADGQ